MMDFVVSFRLPGDEHLFIRHETNVRGARNAGDAVRLLRRHLPGAFGCTAEPGLVMLYGRAFVTLDDTRERFPAAGAAGAT